MLAGGDGGENVDVHRKISRDTQLITDEVGYELEERLTISVRAEKHELSLLN